MLAYHLQAQLKVNNGEELLPFVTVYPLFLRLILFKINKFLYITIPTRKNITKDLSNTVKA